MNGHTTYQIIPTSLKKWIIVPITFGGSLTCSEHVKQVSIQATEHD